MHARIPSSCFGPPAMPRDPGIKIDILARRECDLTESLQPRAGPEVQSTDPRAFIVTNPNWSSHLIDQESVPISWAIPKRRQIAYRRWRGRPGMPSNRARSEEH